MEVITGASFTLATDMVKLSVTDPPFPSLTVITTLWSPTFAFNGVPDKLAPSNSNQVGTVVPVNVRLSSSSSEAVTV